MLCASRQFFVKNGTGSVHLSRSVCLSFSLSICLLAGIYSYQSVHLLAICSFISPSVCWSTCPSVLQWLSIYLLVIQSACLSMCLFVNPSISLIESVHQSDSQPVYLPIHLPVQPVHQVCTTYVAGNTESCSPLNTLLDFQ